MSDPHGIRDLYGDDCDKSFVFQGFGRAVPDTELSREELLWLVRALCAQVERDRRRRDRDLAMLL